MVQDDQRGSMRGARTICEKRDGGPALVKERQLEGLGCLEVEL